ncbi:MAG TPA: hypothetical protein PLL78_14790 [Fimbriimonadaceae bacterium]|nr:hypothetical protein [Fimbriimonadaceae bacterium]HRJ97940.1 hypothetical protein [Fimbriimonadaceae bacterium]
MKQFVSTLLVALLGGLASAQIDDAQAIAAARSFVERFAPEARNSTPSIYRETLETTMGQTVVIHVNFDDFVVFLTESGEFRALANMGGERRVIEGSEPDKYATDEEAWRALEAILADFEVPSELTRKELVRNAPGGEPFIMRFVMHPRPYGYEAQGGNAVHASIHQKTGRLRSLRISKGWTYEPPNIRISREQAIEIARNDLGGLAEDWQYVLRYAVVGDPDAPASARELRANSRLRLYYDLWSSYGNTRIDSVTGEVIESIAPNEVARGATTAPPPGRSSKEDSSEGPTSTRSDPHGRDRPDVSRTKNSSSRSSPSLPAVALITLTALAGVGGLALALRKSRRA